jgi:hypothetical protein
MLQLRRREALKADVGCPEGFNSAGASDTGFLERASSRLRCEECIQSAYAPKSYMVPNAESTTRT